jgi:ABC-type nitrate/sulfonate/bicarbonate transport system permease component
VIRAVYPFAVLVAAWAGLSALGVLGNEFVAPPPGRVLGRARELSGEGVLGPQIRVTLGRVLLAFALALVAGVALGTLIGSVRTIRLALRPLVSFLFPTPKVALYPALLILFGLGSASKVALGASEALFPVVLATAAGTSQVSPRLAWSAAALGSGRRGVWLKVLIPAALPAILTGARIGLVGAIVGVFLGEMIAGSDGLGHLMAVSYRTLDTPAMYVAVITISVIGFGLDRAFGVVRSRLLAWSPEER